MTTDEIVCASAIAVQKRLAGAQAAAEAAAAAATAAAAAVAAAAAAAAQSIVAAPVPWLEPQAAPASKRRAPRQCKWCPSPKLGHPQMEGQDIRICERACTLRKPGTERAQHRLPRQCNEHCVDALGEPIIRRAAAAAAAAAEAVAAPEDAGSEEAEAIDDEEMRLVLRGF